VKHYVCGLLGIFLFVTMPLAEGQPAKRPVMKLWPAGAPGEQATHEPEKDMTTAKDGEVGGRRLIRLGNVTTPTLTLYAAKHNETGTAVLVFPGGGYHILALDLEGSEVCEWLNSIGVTAVLVKYRVPAPPKSERYAQPLQDAQRAMSLVRAHADEWHIRKDRIGVLGFSAGGHLAALISGSGAGKRTYPQVDPADQGEVRPNFTVLIYPAYLSVGDKGEMLAPEIAPSASNPPAFLVQTEDDHTFVEGSLLYYRALKRVNVPAEMHLFSSGGHGYGLRPGKSRVTNWPAMAADWMHSIGMH